MTKIESTDLENERDEKQDSLSADAVPTQVGIEKVKDDGTKRIERNEALVVCG